MATGVCKKNCTAVFLPVCMLFAYDTQATRKKLKIFYRKALLRSSKNWAASGAKVHLKAGSGGYLLILQLNTFAANATFSRLLKKKKTPWKVVTCPCWTTWLKGTLWN